MLTTRKMDVMWLRRPFSRSYICNDSHFHYIDQVMLPENFTEFFDDLTFQVKNNIIPMSRIDDAVKRILRVKFVMGLFENPMADLSLANQLGSQVYQSIPLFMKYVPSIPFYSRRSG